MADILEEDLRLENSDQEYESEPGTPDTPVSAAASPRKKKKSREKYLTCPVEGCGKAFNRPARLEEHKRSHTNDRIFKCTEPGCNKDFLRNTHLKRHIEANHTDGPKAYICKYEGCGQSFVTNQRLKRHHTVHEKRDKYTCKEPNCGETFRKHKTLNQHTRIVHQGQYAFPCDEVLVDGTRCTRGFADSYYLKLHKGRDHGAKSYFCTICPDGPHSSFGTFSDLQTHNRIVHPPTCNVCGFIGKTVREIAKHVQNKHSGDTLASRQKYICPFPDCQGKGFVESKNLKIHIRTIHEDQKPYQCGDTALVLNHVEDWDVSTACGRAFSHKATLENHIRSMHMGLESMQTQRLKRKADSTGQKSKAKKRSKVSRLDFLTGASMVGDSRRTIPCSIRGCDYMFMREWDRVVHLQSRHGIPVEDDWIMTSDMYNDDDDDNNEGEDSGNDEDYEYVEDSGPAVARLIGTRTIVQNPVQYTTVEEELEHSAQYGGRFWIGGAGQTYNNPQFDPYLGDLGDFGGFLQESDYEDHDLEQPIASRTIEESFALDPALI